MLKSNKPLKAKTTLKAHKPLLTHTKIRKQGKVYKEWLKTKDKWLEQNKASYYFCYLCDKTLTRTQLTLDHVLPRSKRPDLRHSLKNLQPCCWACNTKKGSQVYE